MSLKTMLINQVAQCSREDLRGILSIQGPRAHDLALGAVRAAQQEGLACAVLDCAGAMGVTEFQAFGIAGVMVAQPQVLKAALDAATRFVDAGARVVVLRDFDCLKLSAAKHLITHAEESAEARAANQAMQRLEAAARSSGAAVYVTSGDEMSRSPGSMGFRYYARLRIRTHVLGRNLWAVVLKNKLGPIQVMAQVCPPGEVLGVLSPG